MVRPLDVFALGMQQEREYLGGMMPNYTGQPVPTDRGIPGIPGEIFGELSQAGYPEAVGYGALGNAQQESGFNPTALNEEEGAYGLFQWRGPRLAALRQYAASTGDNPAQPSPVTQTRFAIKELETTHKKAADALKTAKTPEEAAAIWDKLFEISSGAHTEQRARFARAFAGGDFTGVPGSLLTRSTKGGAVPGTEQGNIDLSELEENLPDISPEAKKRRKQGMLLTAIGQGLGQIASGDTVDISGVIDMYHERQEEIYDRYREIAMERIRQQERGQDRAWSVEDREDIQTAQAEQSALDRSFDITRDMIQNEFQKGMAIDERVFQGRQKDLDRIHEWGMLGADQSFTTRRDRLLAEYSRGTQERDQAFTRGERIETQGFTAEQSAEERAYQMGLQGMQQEFEQAQQNDQQMFESGSQLQAETAAARENALDRGFRYTQTMMDQEFQRGMAGDDRIFQTRENELDRLQQSGLQGDEQAFTLHRDSLQAAYDKGQQDRDQAFARGERIEDQAFTADQSAEERAYRLGLQNNQNAFDRSMQIDQNAFDYGMQTQSDKREDEEAAKASALRTQTSKDIIALGTKTKDEALRLAGVTMGLDPNVTLTDAYKVAGGGKEPPEMVQNWEYFIQHQEDMTPESRELLKDMITSGDINLGETADAKLLDSDIKQLDAYREVVAEKGAGLQALDTLRSLNALHPSGRIPTGALASVSEPVRAVLASAGMLSDEGELTIGLQQAMRGVTFRMVSLVREPGQTSNLDLQNYLKANPNIGNSPFANKVLEQALGNELNYQREVEDAMSSYLRENKSLNGWNKELKRLEQSGELQQSFYDVDDTAKLKAARDRGQLSPGDIVMDRSSGTAVPLELDAEDLRRLDEVE